MQPLKQLHQQGFGCVTGKGGTTYIIVFLFYIFFVEMCSLYLCHINPFSRLSQAVWIVITLQQPCQLFFIMSPVCFRLFAVIYSSDKNIFYFMLHLEKGVVRKETLTIVACLKDLSVVRTTHRIIYTVCSDPVFRVIHTEPALSQDFQTHFYSKSILSIFTLLDKADEHQLLEK